MKLRGQAVVLALLAVLVCHWAHAQQPSTNVLDWKASATLSTYLLQQLHTQYTPRTTQLSQAAQSAAGAVAYRDSVRARFRRVLGPLPDRTPLHAQVTGQLVRAGFRIEKVIYESTPHHHVTANLYVPSGAEKKPGVLLFCGHEAESKATVSYQKTAVLFAQHGFVVLVIDPVSQGERMQLTDATGKALTRGGTTEHTLLNASAALLGRTLPAEQLWDNARGLDYLLTRPEVDTTRLGCLGNSGGATQTAYFMALEPRMKVAALCSYVASGERNLELTGPADGCVQLPGAGRAGLDLADWPIMFAPRPLLMLAGRYDFVDYTQIQATMVETGRIYKAMGKPEQLDEFSYDDGHGISQPKREAAVAWFRRWFYADARPISEGSLPVSTVQELQCTTTGQVATSFPDEESLAARYQDEARQVAAARSVLSVPEISKLINRQLAIPPLVGMPLVERRDTVRRDGLLFQKLILRCAYGPPVPVLLCSTGKARPKRVVVCFSDRGKAMLADSAARLRALLASRAAVLLVDLRGQGETTDPSAFNDPKYYNREYRLVMLGLHLDEPLPAQRVKDVLTVVGFLGAEPAFKATPVELWAEGQASALVALHAAALQPRITRVHLPERPRSYEQLLMQPAAKDTYSNVLPGILQHYDLADLLRVLGSRVELL
ncbi:alpha/beta hydrolase family protein [Hymenobacter negativus]|uniref:Acetylxylan esterase n=1 Tax=Hymenobacter negativus TaxID=2795026 RepID=A0ABS3QLB8_9BACT|nr:acetylxylan esterase [Hymenobacter negativus]MBO2012042.1 acetylxylan esterase [Hymenobacter negativus]